MDLSGWDGLRFCCSIHLALWLCHATSLYIELSVWTDTMEWGMDENNTPMIPASAPLPTLITLTAERDDPSPVSPLLCRWPLKGESVPFSVRRYLELFPNYPFFCDSSEIGSTIQSTPSTFTPAYMTDRQRNFFSSPQASFVPFSSKYHRL